MLRQSPGIAVAGLCPAWSRCRGLLWAWHTVTAHHRPVAQLRRFGLTPPAVALHNHLRDMPAVKPVCHCVAGPPRTCALKQLPCLCLAPAVSALHKPTPLVSRAHSCSGVCTCCPVQRGRRTTEHPVAPIQHRCSAWGRGVLARPKQRSDSQTSSLWVQGQVQGC